MANGTKIQARPLTRLSYAPIKGRERLAIWEAIAGLWKNRKPDPIKELNKMRREWDRKTPRLRNNNK